MSGIGYYIALVFQFYYLLFSLCQSNLADVLFCSWLLFACEQLQHLKGIMRPLMELSASLDTYRPNSAALFRTDSANSKSGLIENDGEFMFHCINIKTSAKHQFAHLFSFIEKSEFNNYDVSNIYSSKGDWGAQFRAPTTLQNFGYNPNGLTKKQEMMVRSAIKYWVERHKHVVRLV